MRAHAFDVLRLHKVTADAYATNEPSRGLFESVGFVQEGVGREDVFLDGQYQDSFYYGLLEDEWPSGDAGSRSERSDSQPRSGQAVPVGRSNSVKEG